MFIIKELSSCSTREPAATWTPGYHISGDEDGMASTGTLGRVDEFDSSKAVWPEYVEWLVGSIGKNGTSNFTNASECVKFEVPFLPIDPVGPWFKRYGYHLSIILNTHVECSNSDSYAYSGLLPEVFRQR